MAAVTPEPNPCSALGCQMQAEPIEMCRDHRCPHRWTREGREDRVKREAKDRRLREEGEAG